MKKITIILFLTCITYMCNAQLPNGTVAPNFTTTDINGNSHTLYDYLDAGKTVILEFSGVNCGPCWKYHVTDALKDFYNAFGPEASDEVAVFYIEEARYTTIDDLRGIPANTSFGNWIEGTPYPMILSTAVHDLYQITYAPTIYRICPGDRLLTLMGRNPASTLTTVANVYCSANLQGVQNYAKAVKTINGFCTGQDSFKADFKNYGRNNIMTASFNLKQDNIVIATKSYRGNLSQFSTASVVFDEVIISPSSLYSVEIEDVNGVPNYNSDFSQADLPFYISGSTGSDIEVKIHTNENCSQLRWKITDSNGTIVTSGGPYQAVASNMNAIITHIVTLPPASECYNFTYLANGYGWRNYYWGYPETITPGVEIYSADNNLIYSHLNIGDFGYELTEKNIFSIGVLNTQDLMGNIISMFPNPTTGMLTINSEDSLNVNVYDMLGKTVFYATNINQDHTINLSHLANGVYVVKALSARNETTVQKIILNH